MIPEGQGGEGCTDRQYNNAIPSCILVLIIFIPSTLNNGIIIVIQSIHLRFGDSIIIN